MESNHRFGSFASILACPRHVRLGQSRKCRLKAAALAAGHDAAVQTIDTSEFGGVLMRPRFSAEPCCRVRSIRDG
jgi:hypothetical protein